MKISKMIQELEALRKKHGEQLEVVLSGCNQEDEMYEVATEGVELLAAQRHHYTNGSYTPRVMVW